MKTELTHKILTAERINELRIELWHIVKDLPSDRLLQLMGMVNCYSFSIARRWDAVVPDVEPGEEGVRWRCMRDRLLQLTSACLDGLGEVTTTVLYLQKYLKRFWDGACNSCPSIRKMRVFMRDALQLFDFTPQQKGRTIVPPDMMNVDFVRMLITFEVCELEYMSRCVLPDGFPVGSELDQFMPEHKGVLVVEMFNSALQGIAKYRRSGESETYQSGSEVELPKVEELPKHQVTWRWQGCFEIAKKIWVNLAKKYQRMTGRRIEIDEDEPAVQNKWENDRWQGMESEIPY